MLLLLMARWLQSTSFTSVMDELEIRDFACARTRELCSIALDLSEESDKHLAISPKLVDLADRLYCVAEALEYPLASHQSITPQTITWYLRDLENFCTVRVEQNLRRWKHAEQSRDRGNQF